MESYNRYRESLFLALCHLFKCENCKYKELGCHNWQRILFVIGFLHAF